MVMEECKRSGEIPVFGEWDKANEMPITQYFESARQAGLIRHQQYHIHTHHDLYAVDFQKPHFYAPPRKTKAAMNKKRCPEQKWTARNECGPQRPQKQFTTMKSAGRVTAAHRPTNPKPVDADLYEIPPHLLPGYKRKRMFGFLSRCLAPPCKA